MKLRRLVGTLSIAIIALTPTVGCSSNAERSSAVSTSTPEKGVSVTFTGDQSSKFCEFARRLFDTRVSGEIPADALRKEFEFAAQSTNDMIASAPDEIRGDVKEFLKGVKKLAAALEAVGYDKSALDAETNEALNDPAYAAAGTRVAAYHDQVCAEPRTDPAAPDSAAPTSAVEGSDEPPQGR